MLPGPQPNCTNTRNTRQPALTEPTYDRTGAKALPPLSKTPVVGEIVAPFRGGSGEGVEGCSISSSAATVIRDLDVESTERRREARAASEKARKFLEERRQAQKALKAQVSVGGTGWSVCGRALPCRYTG